MEYEAVHCSAMLLQSSKNIVAPMSDPKKSFQEDLTHTRQYLRRSEQYSCSVLFFQLAYQVTITVRKQQKTALYITKTHQKFLTDAASFGFADIAFSLEITLTTFPSTTGTAYSNNLEHVIRGRVYQSVKTLQELLTFLKAIEDIAPAVYSPIPLMLRRSETVSGKVPPCSTTSFAPCESTDIYNKQTR